MIVQYIHQYIERTRKYRIVRPIAGTRGNEGYKSVFPHQQFTSSYDARRFLYEQGLRNPPTHRHHIDHSQGIF
jgi:hypothetical protein